MTTATRSAYDRACAVQRAVEAALRPGGSLHPQFSDLLSEAEGVAFDSIGLGELEDRGIPWSSDRDGFEDRVGWFIAEELFKQALEYASRTTLTPVN